jgi:hypothetical protein
MRRLPVFLVLTLGVVSPYALALSEQEKTPDKAVPEIQQEEAVSDRDKPALPVKKYTPTEKIKADSAVSFPVDI